MAEKPELFFALVGAVGCDLSRVQDRLEQDLRRVGYTPVSLRLSHAMRDSEMFPDLIGVDDKPEDERIDCSMDAGDKFRETAKRGSAVAMLGLLKIRQHRRDKTGEPDEIVEKTAYIFNSLKHPDEVKLLRDTYRNHLFVLSAYAPLAQRKTELSKKIATSRNSLEPTTFKDAAQKLIEKDEKEVDNDYGQNVRDTFPLADYFIDLTNGKNPEKQISRFIDILFKKPFVTPTKDEFAFFMLKLLRCGQPTCLDRSAP